MRKSQGKNKKVCQLSWREKYCKSVAFCLTTHNQVAQKPLTKCNAHFETEKHRELEHEIGSLKSEKSHIENQFKILQQKNEIMVEMYQQKENALQQ